MMNPAPGAGVGTGVGTGTGAMAPGGTMMPGKTTPMARDRRWRGASLSSILMFLGTMLWLIGSALFIASQPRFNVVFIPGATPTSLPSLGSAAITSGGDFTGAWICWIIAGVLWVLGALTHQIAAFGQAAMVTVSGRRPGIATWHIIGAFLQLLGTIIVLIGAIVFSGGSLGAVGAGAVLFLIGFTIWAHAVIIAFGVSFVVSTMTPLMLDYRQRQYAWNGLVSTLLILVQFILISLGAVLLVVRDPPGIWLTCALLWTVASIYGLFGWMLHLRGTWGFFTPVLGFGTAAYGTSTLGGAAGGAGAGMATGALAGGATGAALSDKDRRHSGAGGMAGPMGAAPMAGSAAPMGTGVGPTAGTTAGMGGAGMGGPMGAGPASAVTHPEAVQVAV